MHIYDKQCEIMQKNKWKSPNIQIQFFYVKNMEIMQTKTAKSQKFQLL